MKMFLILGGGAILLTAIAIGISEFLFWLDKPPTATDLQCAAIDTELDQLRELEIFNQRAAKAMRDWSIS